LAANFPAHGLAVTDAIKRMAAELDGTQAGVSGARPGQELTCGTRVDGMLCARQGN